MCLLIAATKDFPSLEILRLGEEQNGHGGGIAWVENGLVHWKKGIKAENMLEFEAKGPPWIIHFRLATYGGQREDLCHPFPVTKDCATTTSGSAPAVLAHNGSWREWSKELLTHLDYKLRLPKGPWSDTRAIAWLTHLKGEAFVSGLHEKVVILTPEGAKIFSKHMWTEKNGLLLSYDPFTRIKSTGGKSVGLTNSKSFPSQQCNNNQTWSDTVPCQSTSTGDRYSKSSYNARYRPNIPYVALPLPIDV